MQGSGDGEGGMGEGGRGGIASSLMGGWTPLACSTVSRNAVNLLFNVK